MGRLVIPAGARWPLAGMFAWAMLQLVGDSTAAGSVESHGLVLVLAALLAVLAVQAGARASAMSGRSCLVAAVAAVPTAFALAGVADHVGDAATFVAAVALGTLVAWRIDDLLLLAPLLLLVAVTDALSVALSSGATHQMAHGPTGRTFAAASVNLAATGVIGFADIAFAAALGAVGVAFQLDTRRTLLACACSFVFVIAIAIADAGAVIPILPVLAVAFVGLHGRSFLATMRLRLERQRHARDLVSQRAPST